MAGNPRSPKILSNVQHAHVQWELQDILSMLRVTGQPKAIKRVGRRLCRGDAAGKRRTERHD